MNIPKNVLAAINESPELLSLLYDCNRLPEQVRTGDDVATLVLVVAAFKLGQGRLEEWVEDQS